MGTSVSPVRPHGWKAWVCGLAIAGAALGTASAVGASPTVPGAPTITSVSAGDHSIRVAFSKPAANGGSPIFLYKAVCSSSNGGATRSDSDFRTVLHVSGLSAGKTYTCTVAARNRVGFGPASAPSAPVLVLPILPGAPTITSVRPSADRSVRVAFTRPASSGGTPIFLYKAVCSSSNGGATRSDSDFRTLLHVSGLSAGKTYTCTVAARNRVGFGPASAPSASFVALPIPPVAPGAPTINSATTAGIGNISVAFSPPADNGGAGITDYKVICVSSDGGVTRTNDRNSTTIVVHDLTTTKTYTCTVDARNRVGFGPPSAPSAPVVVLGKPVIAPRGRPRLAVQPAGYKVCRSRSRLRRTTAERVSLTTRPRAYRATVA